MICVHCQSEILKGDTFFWGRDGGWHKACYEKADIVSGQWITVDGGTAHTFSEDNIKELVEWAEYQALSHAIAPSSIIASLRALWESAKFARSAKNAMDKFYSHIYHHNIE